MADHDQPRSASSDTARGATHRPSPGVSSWALDPDRCFSPVPSVRELARELYAEVRELPIVSPHATSCPSFCPTPRHASPTPPACS